nr:OmpA family protein [Chitinophagaceae bacterium]
MKIQKVLLFIPLFAGLVFLNSCYNYGKSHEPYTNAPKVYNLPPPPKKMVGEPISKREYLQKTYTELKSTLEEAEVVMIEDSIKVLFPSNIVYKSGGNEPSSEYRPSLEKFAILLKKYFKTNILISGHTDNIGDANKNRELSRLRALHIKNILTVQGVAGGRLTSWGLGALSPIADNSTTEGRDKNRRVEFVVLFREK